MCLILLSFHSPKVNSDVTAGSETEVTTYSLCTVLRHMKATELCYSRPPMHQTASVAVTSKSTLKRENKDPLWLTCTQPENNLGVDIWGLH